jgi:DNA replication protein DnaC
MNAHLKQNAPRADCCIRFLGRTSLLIVDEIRYLPVIPGGGNLFFQLANARYERGAMILTSNRGFGEWGDGDSMPSDTLIDNRWENPGEIYCSTRLGASTSSERVPCLLLTLRW